MRVGGWYRAGKRSGVFVSTSVGNHARRAAGSGAASTIALLLFVALVVGAWLLLG